MFSDVQCTPVKYGQGGSAEQESRRVMFWVLSCLATAVSFLGIIPLVLTWVLDDIKETGLEASWTGSNKTFNWHPTLTVIGFMAIMSHSMLVYRVYSRLGLASKTVQKTIHVILMVIVLTLLSIAYAAVVDYHNKQGYHNVRSMHSWLGISTGVLFCSQFLFGLAFLLPVPVSVRKVIMPFHRPAGVGTLFAAAATMLTGIQEQMGFDNAGGKITTEALTAQILGLMIVFLVLVVGFLLGRKEFARYQPEHEQIPDGGEKIPLQPCN